MTNTIKLDFDYADIASHNDGAVPPAKSQSHPKDLKLPPLSSNHAWTLLESEAGAAIEDRSGNLLAIWIPNVFSPIHEEILNAGHEFNQNFKFDKKKSRNHFVPSLDLFQKGQVHYGYWHQQGHYEISPQISTNSKEKEHNHPFQKKCEPLYHILNMYTERIVPSLAKQSDQVWEQIRKHWDHEGFLSEIKSHFFGQMVHFNADIRRHKDRRSAWCGFDAIAVFGEYEGGISESWVALSPPIPEIFSLFVVLDWIMRPVVGIKRLGAGLAKGKWFLHFFLIDGYLHTSTSQDLRTWALSMGCRDRKNSVNTTPTLIGDLL
ncbi:uncharacterized protein EI90DRAFT_3155670 [Cantharellus anzutake]|uniref:uncharacterized protein n=1 Tax=Cantharellus anzutake TaxID=1750568 RepID=UPI00190441F9|nr:uncharacterized protein EI90DRAFT_3155670 [Cantharellus anzutake]KAF8328723.1 hypothetical protein EI90DRAFT_3155670 [Cantharellus anzutake]